jgi:hypothetical protein
VPFASIILLLEENAILASIPQIKPFVLYALASFSSTVIANFVLLLPTRPSVTIVLDFPGLEACV